MNPANDEPEHGWKLVTEFGRSEYSCGLRPNDLVRVIKELQIVDSRNVPTGKFYRIGDIGRVLHGASESPGIVFLRWIDSSRLFTWSDDKSIFEYFERMEEPNLKESINAPN